MTDGISVRMDFGRLEESSAVVRLTPTGGARLVSATLYGPHCEFARTLPTTTQFTLADRDANSPSPAVAAIMEPCYWTPELPFLYELTVQSHVGDAPATSWTSHIGLRRLSASGSAFRWEGKRRVLRGAAVDRATAEDVVEARVVSAAILAPQPDDDVLRLADRMGTPLVIDLRDLGLPSAAAKALGWHPSVVALVVSSTDVKSIVAEVPAHLVLAIAYGVEPTPVAGPMAIELGSGERPSRSAATHAGPVIAVRRGVAADTMAEARAACDRLQAELAPEFDLAGYFVEASARR